MSKGEDRVRKSFNPSADSDVDRIQEKAAWMIDFCEALKSGDPEQDRCLSLAQTHFEDAAMWAVKGATAKK